MCVVIKVNGLGNRCVSGEPKQFYHPCRTQGTDPSHIDVVDVSGELDTVAGRVKCLEASGSLRVRLDLRTHVRSERFSDRTRHSGCPLEAGVNLDAIRLTLSAGASIKSVGRQLIATVANVRARSIDEAGVSPALKAGGVSEKFGLGGATQQQSRERITGSKDALVQAIKSTGSRDGNARDQRHHDQAHAGKSDAPGRDVNHHDSSSSSSRPRMRSRARLVPESAGLPISMASL